MTSTLNTAARNLTLLLVVAIPLAILTGWIEGLIYPVEWVRDLTASTSASGSLSAVLFWYLVLFVPVLVGGILHQVVLRVLPMPREPGMRRITVLLTAPIVLVGFLFVGNSLGGLLTPRAIAPIIVALLGYSMLARWSSKESADR